MAPGATLALIGAVAVSPSGPAYTQSGQPKGPNVRVVNMESEPVPVKDTDSLSKEYAHMLFRDNDSEPVVPAGKRHVFEHITRGVLLGWWKRAGSSEGEDRAAQGA